MEGLKSLWSYKSKAAVNGSLVKLMSKLKAAVHEIFM